MTTTDEMEYGAVLHERARFAVTNQTGIDPCWTVPFACLSREHQLLFAAIAAKCGKRELREEIDSLKSDLKCTNDRLRKKELECQRLQVEIDRLKEERLPPEPKVIRRLLDVVAALNREIKRLEAST